jgi:hypothetical protein
LFKLILPLPKSNADPQPTAFLLHPSQPLSHLSRLIAGSLPPHHRDVEISYLALTGPESDLDSHLRNAAEEEADLPGREDLKGRQEGGPFLHEREKDKGKLQEVSWSQSTDLSDFIKQSCLDERFKIQIKPQKEDPVVKDMTLEVVIPSFESRTTYLRRRLLELTKELDGMTKQKKLYVDLGRRMVDRADGRCRIDVEAHEGARKIIVAGLIGGLGYWAAVIRWSTFWPRKIRYQRSLTRSLLHGRRMGRDGAGDLGRGLWLPARFRCVLGVSLVREELMTWQRHLPDHEWKRKLSPGTTTAKSATRPSSTCPSRRDSKPSMANTGWTSSGGPRWVRRRPLSASSTLQVIARAGPPSSDSR